MTNDEVQKIIYLAKIEITLNALNLIMSAYHTQMSEDSLRSLINDLQKNILEDYKQMGNVNVELDPLLFFSEN